MPGTVRDKHRPQRRRTGPAEARKRSFRCGLSELTQRGQSCRSTFRDEPHISGPRCGDPSVVGKRFMPAKSAKPRTEAPS